MGRIPRLRDRASMKGRSVKGGDLVHDHLEWFGDQHASMKGRPVKGGRRPRLELRLPDVRGASMKRRPVKGGDLRGPHQQPRPHPASMKRRPVKGGDVNLDLYDDLGNLPR